MNVGLVVDHPKRDLPGIVLTAYELARRGVQAYIIPLYEQATDVPLLALDALIVNFARPANFALVEGYAAMEIPVFVLDSEGGVLTGNGANAPHMLAAYMKESGFSQLLVGYLFWGSRLREAFVAGSGMAAEKLHVTGCPRFDFCSPKWRDTLRYPREGYVLVNANFSLVNPLFTRSPEKERDTLVAAGWRPEYVEKMLSDMRRILQGFLADVVRLTWHHPQQQFLIRPHPFEKPEIYKRAFADCVNAVVDGSGNVLNAIHRATCVLHINCGTAIEAVMLGKLPVSLEYLNSEMMARHGPLPSQISYQAVSYDELSEVVERTAKLTRSFDFSGCYSRYIYPWFHHMDGGAATRIAEVVLSTISGRPRGVPSISSSLAASRKNSSRIQRAQAILNNLLGSLAVSRLRSATQPVRKEKRITLSAVSEQIRLLACHEGRPVPRVRHARHPISGFPLSSITVSYS